MSNTALFEVRKYKFHTRISNAKMSEINVFVNISRNYLWHNFLLCANFNTKLFIEICLLSLIYYRIVYSKSNEYLQVTFHLQLYDCSSSLQVEAVCSSQI
jgi:hypothetical protein